MNQRSCTAASDAGRAFAAIRHALLLCALLPLAVYAQQAARGSTAVLAPGEELSAQFAPNEVVLPGDSVEVPLDATDDNPAIIMVMINGRGPFRFGLETGGAVTVIEPEVAKAAGLVDEAVSSPGQYINVDSLGIGAMRLRGLPVEVRSTGGPGERSSVDGLLCLSAYYELLVTLDYRRGRVRFTRGTLPEPNGRDVLPLHVVPSEFGYGYNGYQIEITVDGERHLALFDTQNGVGFLTTPDSIGGAKYAAPPTVLGAVTGMQLKLARRTVRLADDIRVGGVTFAKPIVSLVPMPSHMPQGWNVGTSALREFVVTLDQRHRRVRLARAGPKTVPPPPPVYTAGMVMTMPTSDTTAYVVADVLPGSDAAHQGIAVGDRVVSVEGLPATFANMGALRRYSKGHKPFRVSVQQGGGTRNVVLTPRIVIP